jgi:hypothetical protein
MDKKSEAPAVSAINNVKAQSGDGKSIAWLSKKDVKGSIGGSEWHSYGTRAILLRIARVQSTHFSEDSVENVLNLCSTVTQNWTNSGVVSSLMLAISTSFMQNVPEQHYTDLSTTTTHALIKWHALLAAISSACSICSIISAAIMFQRLTVHMIDVEDKIHFLLCTKIRVPEYTMGLGILTLLAALLIRNVVSYGSEFGQVIVTVFCCTFIPLSGRLLYFIVIYYISASINKR